MKLSIKDRLIINALYPKGSDIATQLLVRDIKAKVDLTEQENAEIGLKVDNSVVTWDNEKGKDKEH